MIWAKDVADGQVKGFIVPTVTPGYTATKIEGKISLRTVQNADITLDRRRRARVAPPAERELVQDTAKVLRLTRAEVAWSAVGIAIGAYEAAVAYAKEREQFGKPIGAHQLIQDLLVKCLGNITASLGMVVRVSRDARPRRAARRALRARQGVHDGRACARPSRGPARLLGGNGIVLDYDVARFFADAEALYSYEGTREMNTLIVGRAHHGPGRIRLSRRAPAPPGARGRSPQTGCRGAPLRAPRHPSCPALRPAIALCA